MKFYFSCKDKLPDFEDEEAPSQDARKENMSAPKFRTTAEEPSKMEQDVSVKPTTSEPQLGSPELKSADVTDPTMSGQNRTVTDPLKKGRQKFTTTLSAATSWITQKPSVTFTRSETVRKKVKGTECPGQKVGRSLSVSFPSKVASHANRGEEGAQIYCNSCQTKSSCPVEILPSESFINLSSVKAAVHSRINMNIYFPFESFHRILMKPKILHLFVPGFTWKCIAISSRSIPPKGLNIYLRDFLCPSVP